MLKRAVSGTSQKIKWAKGLTHHFFLYICSLLPLPLVLFLYHCVRVFFLIDSLKLQPLKADPVPTPLV